MPHGLLVTGVTLGEDSLQISALLPEWRMDLPLQAIRKKYAGATRGYALPLEVGPVTGPPPPCTEPGHFTGAVQLAVPRAQVADSKSDDLRRPAWT